MTTRYKKNTDWYTDYPFVELGDIPHKQAPIKKVILLSYDGDKYAEVLLPNGIISSVKVGYLYSNPDDIGTTKDK